MKSAMMAVRMRAAALLLLTGCANQAAPPGGQPDLASPLVLKVTPQNNAVGAKPKAVVLQFDEVINETPQGAKDIADLVFISPKSGVPEVDWGRSKIEIRPSKGWKPNTVYSVVIKRGLQDLRNNGIDSTIQLVFSTGGPIPTTRVAGVAFDWAAGIGLSGALVEAVASDSTTYQVVADSSGRFVLQYLPPGPYLLRAYGDRNTNRSLDPIEVWDSVSVTLTQSADVEFYGFAHDTVGLRVSEVTPLDSGVVKVVFDKPYSPGRIFLPGEVIIKRADSSLVSVRRVQTTPERNLADSLRARARADSVARVAARGDSTPALRARTDSLARVRRADSVAAVARTERETRARMATRRGRPGAPIDTTPPPKLRRPLLYKEIYVTLDTVLEAQKQYRLSVSNIRSLSGTVRSPARTFTTPRAPKTDSTKRDSTKRDSTKRDSAAARPAPRPAPRDTLAQALSQAMRSRVRALFGGS
ncbi:Ig-like domain-containing protein [Gemmatimonas sp.]|uniref:Ig-like domain-containing protein n=2 Tax=Gemmatimonas sp. TaxID=1962908 RepID=UPI003567CD42